MGNVWTVSVVLHRVRRKRPKPVQPGPGRRPCRRLTGPVCCNSEQRGTSSLLAR